MTSNFGQSLKQSADGQFLYIKLLSADCIDTMNTKLIVRYIFRETLGLTGMGVALFWSLDGSTGGLPGRRWR